MVNKVYNSSDLLSKVYEIDAIAKSSIISLMNENNIKVIDFSLDKNGNSKDDDTFDEDFVISHNVGIDVETKYGGAEWANISKVELIGDKINITAITQYMAHDGVHDNIVSDNDCFPTITTFIDILSRLEAMFDK